MLLFELLDVGVIDRLGIAVDRLVLWEEIVNRLGQVVDRLPLRHKLSIDARDFFDRFYLVCILQPLLMLM